MTQNDFSKALRGMVLTDGHLHADEGNLVLAVDVDAPCGPGEHGDVQLFDGYLWVYLDDHWHKVTPRKEAGA